MPARVRKNVALRIVTLVAAVFLLPLASLAATSPTVSVLSPLNQSLRTPVKIALDAEGNIYVADTRAGGVVKFNASGVNLLTIRTAAVPNGLAFAQDGTLLVSQGSSVVRYVAATGQEVGRLSGGDLKVPAGIAIDDLTGYIYVVDSCANQVVIFTASGDYVKAFAQGVTADALGNTVSNPLGKLSGPSGITFEKISRQFAVADTNSNRVQFFDTDGNFVKSIGKTIPTNTTGSTTPIGPMQFEAPVATVFEYSNDTVPVVKRIYIIDSFQANIQVVDPATSTALLVAGTTKNYIGSPGTENGKLMFPSDAIFDAVNKRLMVVNGYGNITIYSIDGGINPVDITPPTLSIDPVPATVYVPGISISGTVDAGASVVVTTGATTAAGAVVYTSATTWKCDITELVAGNNTITVTARDAAGNAAPAQSVNVTCLVPAPAMSVSSVPGQTKVSDLVLSGTADGGATVTVTNESTSISGTAAVTGAGWTYKVHLMEGKNNISITAQRPLSLKAAVALEITLDTIPPALTVSALSDGSYTSNQVQNVAGAASDTNSVSVLVNNIPATLMDGSFSVPVSLVTGKNTITVEAGDVAGNVTVISRNVYFDATSPQITITAPMDNSFTNNADLKISGSVDEAATITVAGVPAALDSSNNWSANITLAAGLNTIEVAATDLSGNTSTQKRSIALDTLKPILAISSPVQDVAVNQSSVTIAGTVNDDNTSTLTYSVNDKITSVPVNAGGFSFKVDFLTEGIYPVIIAATDYAGNVTTATRSLIYDITAPVLTLDTVKWQAHALGGKISGTVDPGATVTVKEGSNAIGTVIVDGGKWSADLSGISFNQTLLGVVATDAAGNSTSTMLKANR